MNRVLRPYSVGPVEAGHGEVAVLVFDFTSKAARKAGWHALLNFGTEVEWIDCSSLRMKSEPHIMAQKISDTPHVIDNPTTCPRCEHWGGKPIEKHCSLCHDTFTDENQKGDAARRFPMIGKNER